MLTNQLLRTVDEAEMAAENKRHANDISDRRPVGHDHTDIAQQFARMGHSALFGWQRFFKADEIPSHCNQSQCRDCKKDGTPACQFQQHKAETWGEDRNSHEHHRDNRLQFRHACPVVSIPDYSQGQHRQPGGRHPKKRAQEQENVEIARECRGNIDHDKHRHAGKQDGLSSKTVRDGPGQQRAEPGTYQKYTDQELTLVGLTDLQVDRNDA
ncbi:MAG: hypothetical protein DDT26_02419 [Dehalococcoidia bacterium]|nr:hypothetical protein [Chloroflexota bacterium]